MDAKHLVTGIITAIATTGVVLLVLAVVAFRNEPVPPPPPPPPLKPTSSDCPELVISEQNWQYPVSFMGCRTIFIRRGQQLIVSPRAYMEIMPTGDLKELMVDYFNISTLVETKLHRQGYPEPCGPPRWNMVVARPKFEDRQTTGEVRLEIGGRKNTNC